MGTRHWPEDAEEAVESLRAQLAACQKDAERYRWLRDTLQYPDTPIGFYESKAATLDAAIDEAMK